MRRFNIGPVGLKEDPEGLFIRHDDHLEDLKKYTAWLLEEENVAKYNKDSMQVESYINDYLEYGQDTTGH